MQPSVSQSKHGAEGEMGDKAYWPRSHWNSLTQYALAEPLASHRQSNDSLHYDLTGFHSFPKAQGILYPHRKKRKSKCLSLRFNGLSSLNLKCSKHPRLH